MSEVIWKTALAFVDSQTVTIPKEAVILSAATQHDRIYLWYKCDPRAAKEDRRIAITGTGHEFDFNGKFLGTCVLAGGDVVLHVFEMGVM